MALLLNIDTATEFASVGFSRDGHLLEMTTNDAQKEHAAFLQPAIGDLAKRLGISLKTLDAIALTIGPGSYTGLRVGLSSAKGLAYALHKPLVPVGTLEVMAHAAMRALSGPEPDAPYAFCPMIDARRDEVFTAIFDAEGRALMEPRALILTSGIFDPYLANNTLIFSGTGSLKWKTAFSGTGGVFSNVQHSVRDLGWLAEKRFAAGQLGDLAYLQPLYLKDFYKNS
jgi:tRNA threonylcarbamoyladenosine biosynthesis protein TsaB